MNCWEVLVTSTVMAYTTMKIASSNTHTSSTRATRGRLCHTSRKLTKGFWFCRWHWRQQVSSAVLGIDRVQQATSSRQIHQSARHTSAQNRPGVLDNTLTDIQ